MNDIASQNNFSTFNLTERQRYISEQLEKYNLLAKSENFGSLYTTGLEVLETPLKAKLSLSAHCLREILEKLPEAVAGITATIKQDDRDTLNRVRNTWTTIIAHPAWQDLSWETKVIDAALGGFLKDFDLFHKAGTMTGPSRRDLKEKLIRHLNKTHPELSAGFIDAMVARWNKIEKYMKSTSHNGGTTKKDFEEYLNKFDDLLFDLFKQPVLENVDEIDAIIAEGEKR